MSTLRISSSPITHTIYLEPKGPERDAVEAATKCFAAGRDAARLLAAHVPRAHWPGSSDEEKERLWTLLAKRGLPSAPSEDLVVLRRCLRGLRGGVESSLVQVEDGGLVVDDQDDRLSPRPEVDLRGGNAVRAAAGRETSPEGFGAPEGLINALEVALDQARSCRDAIAALGLLQTGSLTPTRIPCGYKDGTKIR